VNEKDPNGNETDMAVLAQETGGRRRKFTKEVRRQQLINATIESISKRGFSDTTLSHVSKQAGLSQGIVNLHFTNKENLLIETLKFLSDDYRQAWQQELEAAGPTTTDKLRALLDADFLPSVCEKKKLAVWFAFQGEAKSRPTYRQICEDKDIDYKKIFAGYVQDLIREGNYQNIDPMVVSEGMHSLCEGLWLSILAGPGDVTRQRGRYIYYTFMTQFFPDHFPMPDDDGS
jgi:TetR/AcrR family transcriptional repressor of bet genes